MNAKQRRKTRRTGSPYWDRVHATIDILTREHFDIPSKLIMDPETGDTTRIYETPVYKYRG